MRWQDPELQARLAEMSAKGRSATEIAAVLGESREAVKRAMTRYGLFASTRGSGRVRRRVQFFKVGLEWQSN